jgi:hypothetical protein
LDRQAGNWNFTPTKELVKLYGCEGTRLASSSDFGRSITWLEAAAQEI